jgi:hypothetical protein
MGGNESVSFIPRPVCYWKIDILNTGERAEAMYRENSLVADFHNNISSNLKFRYAPVNAACLVTNQNPLLCCLPDT